MKSFDRQLLREAIAGPNALDFKALPIYLLMVLPFTVIAEGSAIDDTQDLLLWTLVKFLSMGAIYGTWTGLKKLWLTFGKGELKLLTFLAMSGAGGIVQGLSVSLLCSIFNLTNAVPTWSRALIGLFFSITWLPVIALVTHSRNEYTNFRLNYVNELQRIERVTLLQSGLAEIISEELNASLESELTRNKEMAFQRLDQLLVESAPLAAISEELREIANVNIREHSHRLWALSQNLTHPKSDGSKNPRFQTFEMFRLTLEASPINPTVYSIIILSIFAPVIIRNQPNGTGVLLILSFMLPLLSIQLFGSFLAERSARHRIAIGWLTAFTTAIVPVATLATTRTFLAERIHDISPYTNPLLSLLLVVIFMILTLAKSTVLSHEAVAKSATTELLKSQVLVDYINVELALVSRKWAQFVHGKLQSQLLSIAATLEQARQLGNVEMQMRAISDAQMLFSDPTELFDSQDRTFEEEVSFRIGLWESLISISVDSHITHDLTQATIKKVGTVLEEALSNAVRHGSAENVMISIDMLKGDLLEITVEDDGVGNLVKSQGIGSALFDQVSSGNWTLVRLPEDERTQLRVRISI